ncbi:MAG TPA: biotin--[acetyl-CoA-carboxylase] ligase [Clostridiaceae bacterium]|nr:biotin--[acetyl-CoA-carboxylase] ligase [Clostridiaceae bacterium]
MVNTIEQKNINNTENLVLHKLESNPDKWISGGDLARQAKVSRNTIWRTVRKLQNAGYSIQSVTGRGYRLLHEQDRLSEAGINLKLNNPSTYQIEVFDTIDSTNNILKTKARENAVSGTLIVANAQKNGRGRRGRDFFSPPGTGVYFSLLLRPNQDYNLNQKSPALAAVALAKAIDKITGKTTGIKWVNDIYLNDKKIAGILTEAELDFETRTISYMVIGVGVNIYQPQNDFPEQIANTATAIYSSAEKRSGLRNSIIAEFLNQWEIYAKRKHSEQALNIFREKSVLTNKTVDIWYNNNLLQAKVLNVNEEFELIIELEDGSTKTINHGEATLHQEGSLPNK